MSLARSPSVPSARIAVVVWVARMAALAAAPAPAAERVPSARLPTVAPDCTPVAP